MTEGNTNMKRIKRISDLERKYVNEVLDGEFKSSHNYKMVTRLEKEFAERFNCKYAVAMTNGTATLHAALEAAGVGEGDEVIVPALTMSSTNMCILQANAIPVFADIDPQTFTISIDSIQKVLTDRTKAIIPVALYGLSPDIDSIMKLAEEHRITVIEDDAECILGYYKGRLVGSTAHMSSFSFQSSKHMTAGEGGMVITNDPVLAVNLRRFSGLGYGSIGIEKGRISKDDIQSPTYERHVSLGWNYRPSDLCAAVTLGQLKRIDELVEMRTVAAKHFLAAINEFDWLVPQYVPEGYKNSYCCLAIRLNTEWVAWTDFRKELIGMVREGIYGAWKPGYLEPAYRNQNFLGRENLLSKYGEYQYMPGLCPITEKIQPQLLQFKTNYWDEADAIRQAEILWTTAQYFDDRRCR